MKKAIIIIIVAGLGLMISPSCLEEYLDQAPESGLNEQETFSNYANFRNFLYGVYEGRKYYSDGWYDFNIKTAYPLYFMFWDQKYSWEGLTDAADHCRYMEGHTLKSGQVSAFINKFTYDGKRRPILESMFRNIRKCNMVIKNIDMLQDADQSDKDDFLGQAHFVRAFCHFELMRIWGPMPYLTTVIGPDDPWDIPRLSKYETLKQIAVDMDSAAFYFEKANLMRRDPGPGLPGHLTNSEQARPTGVAAKAYKGRALLYAASPLNNDKGTPAWEDAAKANWEAIQLARQYNYELMSAANYKTNWVGAQYTNEQLYAWNAGSLAWNSGNFQGLISSIFHGTTSNTWSGLCPTQNFVDKFETKWGDPLNTPEERIAASAAGHYNEQDPYANRDPRFDIDILYNQASLAGTWTNGKAQIYYEMKSGKPVYSELLNQSFINPIRYTATGYYIKKIWGENSVKNQKSMHYTDALMRLAELYLNYAEAANEAYGLVPRKILSQNKTAGNTTLSWWMKKEMRSLKLPWWSVKGISMHTLTVTERLPVRPHQMIFSPFQPTATRKACRLQAILLHNPTVRLVKVKIFMTSDDWVPLPFAAIKKRYLTGGYNVISGDDLEKYPSTDIRNAFTGLAPGLDVRELNGSPGLSAEEELAVFGITEKVNISSRGRSMIYIIDEIPTDVTEMQLDPMEIESVTVIKDIVGKSMYGPAGAEGIIFITTRRGRINERILNVNAETGINTIDRMPEWVSGADYARLNNMARVNSGLDPLYSESDISAYAKNDPYDLVHPSVNFFDMIIKKSMPFRRANVSSTGGNDRIQYFAYLGYNGEGDIYKIGSTSDYNRLNARSNLDVKINNFLKARFDFYGGLTYRRSPNYGYDVDFTSEDAATNPALSITEFPVMINDITTIPPIAFPVYTNNDPALKSPWYGVSPAYGQNPVGNLVKNGYYTSRAAIF